MATNNEWRDRVGTAWAEEWQRTDRSFGGLTDHLLGKVSERPIMRALDVGCGAGEMSLALARGHSGTEVVGVDISPQLIEVANERGMHLANLSFELGDAGQWQREQFAPDLIFSRHGVMFFDDPVASFAHLARIAAPDARLVFSCFRSIEENPWAERVAGLLPPGLTAAPDRFSPGPFAFADQAHVTGLLQDAGWIDVAFEPVEYAYIAGTGPDAIDDAISYFLRIGPAARAAAQLTDEERAHFLARLRRYLANNADHNIVALRANAWIVSARPGRR
ncbi:MAG: methyltransferase domain-containing protein [Pontixanthobacter sp.]